MGSLVAKKEQLQSRISGSSRGDTTQTNHHQQSEPKHDRLSEALNEEPTIRKNKQYSRDRKPAFGINPKQRVTLSEKINPA
jgi:hypothetical protein